MLNQLCNIMIDCLYYLFYWEYLFEATIVLPPYFSGFLSHCGFEIIPQQYMVVLNFDCRFDKMKSIMRLSRPRFLDQMRDSVLEKIYDEDDFGGQ